MQQTQPEVNGTKGLCLGARSGGRGFPLGPPGRESLSCGMLTEVSQQPEHCVMLLKFCIVIWTQVLLRVRVLLCQVNQSVLCGLLAESGCCMI